MNAVTTTPIPALMADLPRDARGYPVPWIVLVDQTGDAHFVCNDAERVMRCAAEHLCGICGKKLPGVSWLVGGVRNAFHRHGAYIDPPMHGECAHYALHVCPYLAMPSYKGVNIEKATERASKAASMVFRDPTQTPGKPQMFVAVWAKPKVIDPRPFFKPMRPYYKVEYWRDGKEVPWNEAREIRDAILNGEMSPVT